MDGGTGRFVKVPKKAPEERASTRKIRNLMKSFSFPGLNIRIIPSLVYVPVRMYAVLDQQARYPSYVQCSTADWRETATLQDRSAYKQLLLHHNSA